MLKNIYILTKFPLSFTVSLSCVFGYILAAQNFDLGLIYPFLAVLLLALGVSALNQIQEYKKDALMARTQNRPIPSGKVSVIEAVVVTVSLILLSFVCIYFVLGIKGILLFSLVIVIYNLLYTKAKRYTIYAGVYGAVLGVIPPYIGWISTGQSALSTEFIALGLFYFTWQIPHFWLLNLKYYKDYENAGFPTITKAFGIESLERITFIWLLLTLICGTFLIVIFKVESLIILSLVLSFSMYILYTIFNLLKNRNYIYNFIHINIYMLVLMILLSINSLYL
ncbi:MAG: UbiA family prenyltransferase [Campylobacteraceae bacterium]|nr:UbiA family prenyltransferase [Campylobacteraceae bacterium]